jgi:hypothetical protein
MKYEFNNRQSGKAYSQMIQLYQNIRKGLKCSVATLTPKKVKRDFEYMTGSELKLEPSEGNKDIYNATLNAL